MSSIDERVVSMRFDNAQFERGVKQTTSTLEKFKNLMSFKGAIGGLKSLGAAGKNLTLGTLASSAQTIASRFSALGIVGVTALANIANQAVNTGLSLAKSLTVDPIMDGFREYELKMGSIQTILANTARHGTGLDDVTASLEELNKYADKTIYNFGDMTRNIGLFTNAGIGVEDATSMIKGFSNSAAASGTSSEGAAGAAYQLSQALSTGTIRLMDWRSLTNVGMGNKNMQNGIIEIADAMGELDKAGISSTEVQADFNGSLEKNWLSADVMSTYLKIMAGDMTDAEIAALGLNDAQVKNFRQQQITAEEAATKVRTLTQLIGTLGEAVGSSWAETWDLLFGDFNEATELFTNASESLGTLIGSMGDQRNKLISEWDANGGRTALIEGLSNAFKALLSILKPIGDAFRQVFPPTSGATLANLTKMFVKFTESLIVGKDTAELIKRSAAGLFAVLGIGWEIVKAGLSFLLDLFGVAQDGSGSFLSITAAIGDFLVGLHKAMKAGNVAGQVFTVLGGIIKFLMAGVSAALSVIVGFGEALARFFSGDGFKMELDFGPAVGILTKIIERFKSVGGAIGKIVDAGRSLVSMFSQIFNVLAKGDFVGGFFEEDSGFIDFLFKLRDTLAPLGDWFKSFFEDLDFNTLTDLMNVGVLAGIGLVIKDFFDGFLGIFTGEGDGIIGSITGVFDALTGRLEAMQNNLNAGTLLKIAGAIALLAAAVLVLSLINSDDLTKALTAMAVMFGQLFAAMAIFEKATASAGFAKMPLVAGAMILLSVAVLILSVAVERLSDLDWEELAKGLTGVVGILIALSGWAQVMSKNSGGLIRASIAMILVGAGVNILASAVEKLADLDWEELARGLVGVLGILGAIVAFNSLGGGGSLKGAVSMVIIGAALHILAGALQKLSTIDPESMTTALVGMAAALSIMAGAMNLMNGSLMGAASLIIVTAALWVLVPLLVKLGEMTWNEIAKASVGLAAALLIIAGAMYLMTGIIVGAASLLVVVAALWVLVPLFIALGEMTWNEIAKASVALAAALLIITGAMYLMTGIIAGAASMLVVVAALWVLVPLFIALGEMSWEEIAKASVALAASLAIIAGAMYLMTAALPGAAALLVVSAALWLLIPVLIALSQLTWEELLIGLAGLAGAFLVIGAAALILAPVVPVLFLLAAAIALLGLGALAAGVGMLAFSIGFAALAGAVALHGQVIYDLIIKLVDLIPYIARKFGEGIVEIARVISGAYPVWFSAIKTVLRSFLDAIDEMAPDIIDTLFDLIMKMADTLEDNVPILVDKGLKLLLGILKGIRDNIGEIVVVAGQIIVRFINGISSQMPAITNAGYRLIITFINSLANTIRNNQSQMRAAGKNLASAIISGMTGGLSDGAGRVASMAKSVARGALNSAKSFLGINSPSKEFMYLGQFSSDGLAVGMLNHLKNVTSAGKKVGGGALDSVKKSVSGISDLVKTNFDSTPTIKPIVDMSEVNKASGIIDGLGISNKVVPKASFEAAASISNSVNEGDVPNDSTESEGSSTTTFIQNNYSPKALSRAEIYRNTNNQLSAAIERKP